jgi:hypothetical protein
VNQHPLARHDVDGAMQHLVRRNAVQDETDRLAGVQSGRHGNQLPLRQADKLHVLAADRQRGNHLSRFDSGDAIADPVHHAGREG